MKLAITAVVLFALCAEAAPKEFRGHARVNEHIRQRLMVKDADFELGNYLSPTTKGSPGLTLLLGSYGGANGKFRNGAPNAANVLLWHTALGGFARDVGKLCAEPRALPVKPSFLKLVESLCKWPDKAAKDPALLQDYWTFVMGYRADQTEFEAWRDFILVQYATAKPAEVIEAMTFALTQNPYFLFH